MTKEKALGLYKKIWGMVDNGEAWIDEDVRTVARFLGEDVADVAEALDMLTAYGMLKHEYGIGYLIGGDNE